jgi:TonB family protein
LKSLSSAFFSLWLGCACVAQGVVALCPKHIETPSYPAIARAAHVTGKVVLALTINAEGNVIEAKVTNGAAMLGESALDNIRHWTFTKPPTAPYTQTIVYDYEIDDSLPADDGSHPIVKVSYDLPDRVMILTNSRLAEPASY